MLRVIILEETRFPLLGLGCTSFPSELKDYDINGFSASKGEGLALFRHSAF